MRAPGCFSAVLALLGVLLALTLPAAAQTGFTDGTGRLVRHGQDSQRIVSLAPNVTEMLFYLELDQRMVGRSSFCNYPPEALELASVGGFADTSIEAIVALKPDLVVAYQGNSLELVEQLRQLGIEVLAFREATTLDEILLQMTALREVVAGHLPQQNDRLWGWRRTLDALTRDRQERPAVFYGMPGELVFSAAPGSFINDLIFRAGGHNILDRSAQRWPQVGAESILAGKPEVLLVGTPCAGHDERTAAETDTLKQLKRSKLWSRLPAVQSGAVVVVDADVLLRPGPRTIDALKLLADELDKH